MYRNTGSDDGESADFLTTLLLKWEWVYILCPAFGVCRVFLSDFVVNSLAARLVCVLNLNSVPHPFFSQSPEA